MSTIEQLNLSDDLRLISDKVRPFLSGTIPRANVQLAICDQRTESVIKVQLQKNGYAVVSESLIAEALAHIALRDGFLISSSRVQAKEISALEWRDFLNLTFANLEFAIVSNKLKIIDKTNRKSIVSIIPNQYVRDLLCHPTCLGLIRQNLKTLLRERNGLAVMVTDTRFDRGCPLIGVEVGRSALIDHVRRQCDDIIFAESLTGFVNDQLITHLNRHQEIFSNYLQLKEDFSKGKFTILPAFTRDSWPSYAPFKALKDRVDSIVRTYMEHHNVFCDPLDLRYQVLFRLTLYRIEDIWENSNFIDTRLRANSLNSGWQSLLDLPIDRFQSLGLNESLILDVVEEQATIISERLSKSKLPISKMLKRRGLFAESGWIIKKYGSRIVVAKQDEKKNELKRIPLEFRLINNDLANQIHRDFHYIHTPRSSWSFGLFIESERLPFSVISVERVERKYKKDTLLLFGYNPDRCLEFTRLYSKPGSPKNTTSAIFGEVFAYFRRNHSTMEAAISCFMPTYSSGLSMLNGGFHTPLYVKPNIHYFAKRVIQGKVCLEHVTKRRLEGEEYSCQASRLPLLPVIELLAPIREPSFTPLLKKGKDMVSVGFN